MEIHNNLIGAKPYVPKFKGTVNQAQIPVAGQNQNSVYSPQSNQLNTQVNAALRAQTLIKPNTTNCGYKEICTFKPPYLEKGKLYQLDNGQKVVIIPKPGPTALRTFVNVGSFNEPDKIRGISHYIEHNLFNGSQKLAPGDFTQKVSEMGGEYNASTDFSNTNYYIFSPTEDNKSLEDMVSMHADMMQNPTFVQKELDDEKGTVSSEIQMYEDDPYDRTDNLVVKNLFNIKADYQGLVAGSTDNIKNLSREDVVNYYNKWYTPDNMTTVLVGDVNPDDAIKLISKNFNSTKPPAKPEEKHYEDLSKALQSPKRVDIRDEKLQSVYSQLSFVGPKNNDARGTLAAEALMMAINGHENAEMRQALKPLNTSANASLLPICSKNDSPQVFSVKAGFTPGEEETGLKTIYNSINKLQEQPIRDSELNIIKNKMKDNVAEMSERAMGLTELVGQSMAAQGLDAYTSKINMIDSLTPQDIQNSARQILDLNKVSIAVAHPASEQIAGTVPAQAPKTSFKGKTVSFGSAMMKSASPTVTEYDLKNNMRLAINDDPNATKTTGCIVMKTDKMPPRKPCVQEILSIMLNDGTTEATKEDQARFCDENNISIGLNTGLNSISANFATDTDPKHISFALIETKDRLLKPDFSEEKFNKAKKMIEVNLNEAPKSPIEKTDEVLYPNDPRGYSRDEIRKSLETLSVKDVKAYYYDILQNAQAYAVITGPVSKQPDIKQEPFIDLDFGMPQFEKYHYADTFRSNPLDKPCVITQTENRNQAKICQTFKIQTNGNIKDSVALNVMNEILGGGSQSRLFQDLRETQQLAYTVRSSLSGQGTSGELTLSIKTSTIDDPKTGKINNNIQKSLDGFKKHINLMCNEPVSKKELDDAKKSIKNSLIMDSESSIAKTSMLSSNMNTLYGSRYKEEFNKALDALTPQDIQKAAKAFLTQPSVVSMVANEDAIKANKDYLAQHGEIKSY